MDHNHIHLKSDSTHIFNNERWIFMDNSFPVESFSKNNAPIHSQNLFVIGKHMIQWNAINKRIFVYSLLFYLSIILSTASSETTTTRRRQWFSPVQKLSKGKLHESSGCKVTWIDMCTGFWDFFFTLFHEFSNILRGKQIFFCVIARGAQLFIDEKLLTALRNKFSKEIFTL